MKVEKFKQFSLKLLCCEARVFPVGTAKTRMRMNLDTWLAAILQGSLQVRLLPIGHSAHWQ